MEPGKEIYDRLKLRDEQRSKAADHVEGTMQRGEKASRSLTC
jgi:hypothetical protein